MSAAPAIELDIHTREFVELKARQIRFWSSEVTKNVEKIGEALDEVRHRLKSQTSRSGDDEAAEGWLGWLKGLGLSPGTAMNYIRVHEWAKSNSQPVANLSIDLKALYLLARKSTPPAAREEAIRVADERLREGLRLDHEAAKKIVAFHKPAKPAPKPKRRTKEQIERERNAERRRENSSAVCGAVWRLMQVKDFDAAEVVDEILHGQYAKQRIQDTENFPLAISILVKVKDELQRRGIIKPTAFGVGRATVLHRAAGN